ncbi:hypothetical protein QBZ16_002421 [Prototheca wickerhamii]|uniref:Uncharacterized protein n=1 Tax=Prototheca wickerhamii TaxID=3111 RepID=A0AAD9MLP3_PROWI|nr:hypothetical protein QBZ16_002421 [Prototheca wickerhamii]
MARKSMIVALLVALLAISSAQGTWACSHTAVMRPAFSPVPDVSPPAGPPSPVTPEPTPIEPTPATPPASIPTEAPQVQQIVQNIQINQQVVNQVTNVIVNNPTNVQATATAVATATIQGGAGATASSAQAFAQASTTGGQATATAYAYAVATVYVAQNGNAEQATSIATSTVLGIYSIYASGQQQLALATAQTYSTVVAAAFGCNQYVAQLINAYISIILSLLTASTGGGIVIIG